VSRRCDHDPRAPRLQLQVPLAPNLPRFVRDMVDRARLIYTHPHRFPELTGEAFTDGARVRMRRSSHREAIALVVASLARRCDRRTLRVGDQRDDGLCTGITVVEHSKFTGLSGSRVKRALTTLRLAGYENGLQPVVRLRTPRPGQACSYAGLPAVRVLRPILLQRMGFKPSKVAKARRRGYEDWQRRRGRPLSPVKVLQANSALSHTLQAFERSMADRLERIRQAAVLQESHVRPPGSR
jgi:hypothetical protein